MRYPVIQALPRCWLPDQPPCNSTSFFLHSFARESIIIHKTVSLSFSDLHFVDRFVGYEYQCRSTGEYTIMRMKSFPAYRAIQSSCVPPPFRSFQKNLVDQWVSALPQEFIKYLQEGYFHHHFNLRRNHMLLRDFLPDPCPAKKQYSLNTKNQHAGTIEHSLPYPGANRN